MQIESVQITSQSFTTDAAWAAKSSARTPRRPTSAPPGPSISATSREADCGGGIDEDDDDEGRKEGRYNDNGDHDDDGDGGSAGEERHEGLRQRSSSGSRRVVIKDPLIRTDK